ncbi:MAG: phage tail protein [Pseudomonadota bacterium]
MKKSTGLGAAALFNAALLSSAAMVTPAAHAQSEPFIGQMMLVAFTYCPQGWAEANGQLLALSSNTALFSLLGTTYGGDGRTTFALPDLRGRHPIHLGQGPGLSNFTLGEQGGSETNSLTVAQLAAHSHAATTGVTATTTMRAFSSRAGNVGSPGGNVLSATTDTIYNSGPADTAMGASAATTNASATTTVGVAGASAPINNRDPYLVMRWCVALQGIFPPRN